MDQGSSSSSSINQNPQPIHKLAKKPGKGVRLTSQTKYVIEKVRQFFEKEKKEAQLRERENHRTYRRGYRYINKKCV